MMFPQDIEKIHTTPRGAERIARNLHLQEADLVAWCKDAVRNADIMFLLGKNWYVYRGGNVLTIHVRRFTVITAHPLQATFRTMRESDFACLPELLYQTIQEPRPPRERLLDLGISMYIQDFGARTDDFGMVAEQNGQVIGAAWLRRFPQFAQPLLYVSLLPEFCGYGIGSKLMRRLFALLQEQGITQTAIVLQDEHPALPFFHGLGYIAADSCPLAFADSLFLLRKV